MVYSNVIYLEDVMIIIHIILTGASSFVKGVGRHGSFNLNMKEKEK